MKGWKLVGYFVGPPCGRCECEARSKVMQKPDSGNTYDLWYDPKAACRCACHWAWRFVHGVLNKGDQHV